jgi:hypothetical protein
MRFDLTNLRGTIDADHYFRGDGSATVDGKVELRDGVLTINGTPLRYNAKKR